MKEYTTQPDNMFLVDSLPLLFVKTASPIVLIMLVNGLFTLVDAYFLGEFVGADALTAVTLMFPLFMMLIALSTLVSNGFSSIFARLLGANRKVDAGMLFWQATVLSLIICALLIFLFLTSGYNIALQAANDSAELAEMGHTYMIILILWSPLVFVLGINLDALRCEGHLLAMTLITLLSATLNILFDYLFIVQMDWGVSGSAYGTVLAQACSLLAIFLVRRQGKKTTPVQLRNFRFGYSFWVELLALGAPSSLGYLGVSLSAGVTLYCLQIWSGPNYEATAGAYGIVTRLMTFTFLPLLGISMAFQTIVGNNYGAQNWMRTNNSLKTALGIALVYCTIVQSSFFLARMQIGFIFVDDIAITNEIGRILPLVSLLLFVFGPLMILGTYFQAIGDATRAAILGLPRTFLFAIPLTFLLPFQFGEQGIWYSSIASEILMLCLTMAVLRYRCLRYGYKWGLFLKPA
ncbi:MAG: MATE family efflux transporter [Hyphomicrobiales bacterium]